MSSIYFHFPEGRIRRTLLVFFTLIIISTNCRSNDCVFIYSLSKIILSDTSINPSVSILKNGSLKGIGRTNPRSVLANGGNYISNSTYSMGVTVGQTLTGFIQETHRASIGFWYADLKLTTNIKEITPLRTNNENIYLSSNYPNPFQSTTMFTLHIPKRSLVLMNIYDVDGRLVDNLINETLRKGDYQIEWNAEGLSSGTYLCHFNSEKVKFIMKMIKIE